MSSSVYYSLKETGGGALAILDNGVSITTGATSIDFTGAGVSVSTVGNDVTVNIPGGAAGTPVYNETPTGSVNGTNKIFTLAHSSVGNSLELYVNGQFMTLNEDYTLSGATITLVTAPPTTSVIRAFYEY